MAIDTERAFPGNFTVEFIITELVNGEKKEFKKEVKIRIPDEEDDLTDGGDPT